MAMVHPIGRLLLFLLLCFPLPGLSYTNPADKAAMDDFYNSLTSKGSLPLSLPSDWCAGVDGISCNGDGKVIEISLFNKQLAGTISSALGTLSALQNLDLHTNNLAGSVPSSLGNLASLQKLWLYGNQLTGTIPSTLGNLSALRYLMLSENKLTGSIPSSLGNLVLLQDLFLNWNQLTGDIPSTLGNLVSLRLLWIQDNQLTGIPSTLGNLGELRSFWAYFNQLTGTIPSTLGNLGELQELYLFGNKLTGTIPSTLGNLASVQQFFLDGNQLTGSIPSTLGNLASVQRMNLGGNKLTSTIPSTLGNLISLNDLMLGYNQLTGSIPSTLSNIPSLRALFLDSNQLTGSIPSFGQASLQQLWLHNNYLTGTIPPLGNLFSLRELYLKGTNNLCPLVDYRSWAQFTDFPGSTDCQACAPFTCQNDGTCSGSQNEPFTCTCPPGWGGANCQVRGCNPEVSYDYNLTAADPGTELTVPCNHVEGTYTFECTQEGEWVEVSNNCEASCPPGRTRFGFFDRTGHGKFASHGCADGSPGYVLRRCTEAAAWEALITSCPI